MQAIGLLPKGDSGYYQLVPVAASNSDITLRSSFSDSVAGRDKTAYNVFGLLRRSDRSSRAR